MRKILTSVVALGATLALAAGCGADGSGTGAQAPSVPSAPTTSAPASATPSTEPSAQPSSPAPTTSAPPTTPAAPKPHRLRVGAKGDDVTAVQKRLTELGYWNGKADGNFGSLTQQAVFALQKAAGLARDGVLGPRTRKALDQGVRPKAKSHTGYVIEIDKRRQLLMLVKDGEVVQTFNTSTGSGEQYQQQDGSTHIASTPSGRFSVYRQIDGWRDAPLGMLWRPKYFNGGIAVHGATSVPPYPASHGCTRLSISAMNYLWTNDKIPLKTKVWVYA